ncbi:MAG: dienelactone hydrolase family protein [Pirellulales bacterium]|nr:dienelactone hydrolase family protein [Pirellulales bacterium]
MRSVGNCCRERLLLGIATALLLWAGFSEPQVLAIDLSYGLTGSYLVGNRQVSVSRTAGGSGSFDALVYYPATATGLNTPLDLSGGMYPVVSFAHGYTTVTANSLPASLAQLASHGYIVVAPQSYESVLDVFETEALGHDQASAYNYLVTQSSKVSSPFYQHVETTGFAAMGHSTGGAASISEASQNAAVKTVVTWAAQNMNIPVQAPEQIADVHVPVQLIAGTADTTVSASTT